VALRRIRSAEKKRVTAEDGTLDRQESRECTDTPRPIRRRSGWQSLPAKITA